MRNEKYALTTAQKEAEKLQNKIESGEASNHANAEKLVEVQKPETHDSIETKGETNVYLVAQKKRGAVWNGDEIWVYSDEEGFIVVYPSGKGAIGGPFFTTGADKDEVRKALLSVPDSTSSTVPFIPESIKDKEPVFYFLWLLREKEYDDIPTTCFNTSGRVEIDGKTIVILCHPNKIGKIIGKDGQNIIPFNEAAQANGYRLVVKADPEIIDQEKKSKQASAVAQIIEEQVAKQKSAEGAKIRQQERLEYQRNELKNEIAYLQSFMRNKQFILEVLNTLPTHLDNEFKKQGFYSQKDISHFFYTIEDNISLKKAREQNKEKQEKLRDQASALTCFRSLLNSNLKDQKFSSVEDFTAAFELILESSEEKLKLSQQKLDELL